MTHCANGTYFLMGARFASDEQRSRRQLGARNGPSDTNNSTPETETPRDVSGEPDRAPGWFRESGQGLWPPRRTDATAELVRSLRSPLSSASSATGGNVMADGQEALRTQVARLYARVHDVDRFIGDIENGGVFVPTAQELPVGSTAMLYAMVPSRSRVMDFRVEVIARRSTDGARAGMPVGVRVRPLDEDRVVGSLRRR